MKELQDKANSLIRAKDKTVVYVNKKARTLRKYGNNVARERSS
jgi:hypothetical protein